MAKKPPPPPLSPPASSSEEEEASSDEEQPPVTVKPKPQTPAKDKDDEDEESGDESEEESDDDDEEPGSDSKKPQPSAPAPAPSKPASESESGSGSGSGSESEDDSDSEAAKLVTPISSRPMADGPVLKASDSEKPNGKPFQRIWTPDDEIAILNAMADFEPEHGPIKTNPNTIGDFLGFVKDSLSTEVSGTQLVDKIKRLKKKYSVVAARAKNKGKGLKFATAHDQAVYELAKKIWGKEEGDDDCETVANGKANGVVANPGRKRGYPLLKEAVAEIEKKTGNSLVVEALEAIDSEKASLLEKKLKKQKMMEIKHKIHELDLLKETLKLIMEGAERAMD